MYCEAQTSILKPWRKKEKINSSSDWTDLVARTPVTSTLDFFSCREHYPPLSIMTVICGQNPPKLFVHDKVTDDPQGAESSDFLTFGLFCVDLCVCVIQMHVWDCLSHSTCVEVRKQLTGRQTVHTSLLPGETQEWTPGHQTWWQTLLSTAPTLLSQWCTFWKVCSALSSFWNSLPNHDLLFKPKSHLVALSI